LKELLDLLGQEAQQVRLDLLVLKGHLEQHDRYR
jgi:hypothetical protein